MRTLRSRRSPFLGVVLVLALSSLSGTIALASGHETLVSVADAGTRIIGQNSLRDVSIDGRYVLFLTDAGSATEPSGSALYVRDRKTGTTALVASGVAYSAAGISNDASTAAFSTDAALTALDDNRLEDVYVVRDGGPPQLVSLRGGVVHSTGAATDVIVSGDGSVVAFTSYASADPTGGDIPDATRRNGMVADLASGVISRVPFPATAPDVEVASIRPLSFTDDGRRVLLSALVTGPDELDRPELRELLYLWNRQTNTTLVVDEAAYSLSVVSRILRFSADGEHLHLVEVGPSGSPDQTVVVDTIDARSGAMVRQQTFDAPERLLAGLDPSVPIPSYWRGSISADGGRVAMFQAPFGETIWVHDLGSGEDIEQAEDFAPSVGLFGFALSADGSTLVFERPATDVAMVVDVHASEVGPSVFSDTGNSLFREDILWLFDQAITAGCTPEGTEFCPDDPVTRGQMAAFVARALGLPSSDVDRFGDDDGSIFEGQIQALAAAGITRGCDPAGTEFCPDDSITRGQMAAFVARALGLPSSDVDRFGDDDGSIFEGEIQALAAAGITRGCDPEGRLFCPDDHLTRGQVAAILHRALADGSRLP